MPLLTCLHSWEVGAQEFLASSQAPALHSAVREATSLLRQPRRRNVSFILLLTLMLLLTVLGSFAMTPLRPFFLSFISLPAA